MVGIALALLGAMTAHAAGGEVLPPEPTTGEWIQDTLDDPNLWFASSENFKFEPIPRELNDYPQGRGWVGVANGNFAWVLYYVPGELLGFEVDTHHLAARGWDFRFSAGGDARSLVPVEANTEELAGYEANWLRLYRATESLPPGTRFLRIEFPIDGEREFARLTEVWLRCRFDDAPLVSSTSVAAIGPTVSPAAQPEEPEIAPFIVSAVRFDPWSAFAPVFPALNLAQPTPRPGVLPPLRVTRVDLLPDAVFEMEIPVMTERRKNVFSTILALLRHRGPHS